MFYNYGYETTESRIFYKTIFNIMGFSSSFPDFT